MRWKLCMAGDNDVMASGHGFVFATLAAGEAIIIRWCTDKQENRI